MNRKQILSVIFIAIAIIGVSVVYSLQYSRQQIQISTSQRKDVSKQPDATYVERKRQITVYIIGSVKNPGVYKIREGTRLYQLIEYAGGSLPDADLKSLNLARTLKDGEKVFIGKKSAPTSSKNYSANNHKTNLHKININTASAKELELLPGIGPKLARRIIEYRASHGSFSSVEELIKVKGIGRKKLAKMREMIAVK